MKHYLLAIAFVGLPVACLAQNIESAVTPKITELKQNYEDGLKRLLKKSLKEGDVAAVSEISAELKKIRTAAPKIQPGEPPVGWWLWNNNYSVSLEASGLATWNDKNYGIWKWIDETARRVEVRWDSGYIDTFTISPDGQNLHIVNNLDHKYVARRIEKE